ncbi:MAG: cob(I)yrinic acid a,c-diamide adenosyltransferase [Hydrogenimonas sp.]|nr:cob(I)yrinic acid a,c-diamide adenosyltransferase [Hydrogenimonas sp.]
MKRGYVELYTGDGKGKTTAAAGLTLRALGCGMKVLFVQFMKSRPSGEIEMLEKCGEERFALLREWDGRFVTGDPNKRQIGMCKDLLNRALKSLEEFSPDLLVLDEIVMAISFKMLNEDEVLEFLKKKPEALEVVMTGRGASKRLIEASDLVTEMKMVKHYYYDKGVEARRGIEF